MTPRRAILAASPRRRLRALTHWRETLAACALLGLPALARAEPARRVPVEVVDMAGGHAYLSAGSAKGLRVGTRVYFGKLERRVQHASQGYAVVSARRLRVGARGVAHASERAPAVERLPKPRALESFADQWPAPVLPATLQRPKPVRLGRMEARPTNVDASLAANGAAFVPLEGDTDAVGRAELRARLHAMPVPSWPLALSGDVALQRWFGRYASGVASGDPRPWLRVRELALALGDPGGYRLELGRLRYAAANLGPLDGGRFEAARWGPLSLAGFGGLLPDAIDGRVERGAGRFGLELDLRGDRALRPELTLVLQGSVFDGRLDERRLYARGQLWPGQHRVSAYAETAVFDEDNPWRRPRVDLAAAGAEFDLRLSALRFGARFDLRKPERSYWLASRFPETWLCSAATSLDARALACPGGDDTRYVAQGFGGWDGGWLTFDAGGAWAGSSDAALGRHALGHATVRLPRVRGRYDLAFGGSHEGGSLVRSSSALRGDFGLGWLDQRVRLNVYYRPAHRRYRASVAGLWEHGAGAALHVSPLPAFAFDLYGDLRIGDIDAALVMLTMLYRLGL